MKYSKGLLLYHDEPAYGIVLKLIEILVPASLLGLAYYLYISGESEGALALLVETVVVGLILFTIMPRSYQVYEDRIQIILGGPFSVKLWFANIKSIETTRRLTFSVNFVTRMTGEYVAIIPNVGFAFSITPKDANAFVEQASDALRQWRMTEQMLTGKKI